VSTNTAASLPLRTTTDAGVVVSTCRADGRYESMAFGRKPNGEIDWLEIDCVYSSSAGEALAAHEAMVERWSGNSGLLRVMARDLQRGGCTVEVWS
jgi:hypothetical protein